MFGLILALAAIGVYYGCNHNQKYSICPKCKSDSIATIMYGLVTNRERMNIDSFKNVLREQKKVLGGCCVRSERFYCYNCGNRW